MVHLATAGPVSSLGLENTIENRGSYINHIHHIIILLVYNLLAIMNKTTKIQNRGSLESEENQKRGDAIINLKINININ
jgi:hypothetical protein